MRTLLLDYIDSEISVVNYWYTIKDPVINPEIMVKPIVLLNFISSLNSPIKPFAEIFLIFNETKSPVVVSKTRTKPKH
jgi:hypothetical protein